MSDAEFLMHVIPGRERSERTRNPEMMGARFSDVQSHIEVRADARPGMTKRG
jgi:hypothetical protein